MSHGFRVEDIAWQAYQAGARSEGLVLRDTGAVDATSKKFYAWWDERDRQHCALPACERCGYDPTAKVERRWTFMVNRKTPSLNDHLVNVGAGRHAYKRERNAWHWEFKAARLEHRIPKASSARKRRLTLVRVFSGRERERDVDNLAGGMKPVVDALVLEGLLLDDNKASVEIHYMQTRSRVSGLSITLEEFA